MQAPEIRKQLDEWLWKLRSDRTQAPPAADLARPRTAWTRLKPKLPPGYHPVIDDRLALAESYLSRT